MNPDDVAAFRCARILVLLDVVHDDLPDGIDAERIGVYDFLAAHPLLLIGADDADSVVLRLAGFDDRAVAYASAAHRLAAAQLHLPRDLAVLVGAGLVRVTAAGRIRYRLTDEGRTSALRVNAAYAASYRRSAHMVTRRLRRLSGHRLREVVRRSVAQSPLTADGRLHPAYLDPAPDPPDPASDPPRPGSGDVSPIPPAKDIR